jgi:pyroglutamyl-peptidase
MAPRILVTGFRPFLGEEQNPSELVLKALATARLVADDLNSPAETHYELHTLVLPVEYRGAFAVLRAYLETHEVDAILLLGQAAGARRVRLERVALNLMDAAAPDESGLLHLETEITAGGALSLRTSLPLRQWFSALGDPAKYEISNSAGAYVCNSTYYLTLQHLATAGLSMPCLFVHVPPMPSQKLAADPHEFPMQLAETTALVQRLLPLLLAAIPFRRACS